MEVHSANRALMLIKSVYECPHAVVPQLHMRIGIKAGLPDKLKKAEPIMIKLLFTHLDDAAVQ